MLAWDTMQEGIVPIPAPWPARRVLVWDAVQAHWLPFCTQGWWGGCTAGHAQWVRVGWESKATQTHLLGTAPAATGKKPRTRTGEREKG